MQKELKDKWVAALRSGEYKQGQRYLETDGKNCCLGVLCKIENVPYTMHRTKEEFIQEGNAESREYYLRFCGFSGNFSQRLRDQFGLDNNTIDELISMNDGSGQYNDNPKTFPEIADWIEANV